jgi:hypothetical protein
MTNDAHAFLLLTDASKSGFRPSAGGGWRSAKSKDVLLPVYEGRMVHQYNSTAKAYTSGSGRSALWSIPDPSSTIVVPHYFVTENFALSKGWLPRKRAAYCEISGHANDRTVLAALVPDFAICGNKVPVLRLEGDQLGDHFLWLAYANSLVIDWIMRRWVSTTVNFFYWKNIPLPTRRSNVFFERRIQEAAKNLSVHDSVLDVVDNLHSRALLRFFIDASVIAMYDLTGEEVGLLLEDFPRFLQAPAKAVGVDMNETFLVARNSLLAGKSPLRSLSSEQKNAIALAYTPRAQAKFLTRT